MTWSSPGPCAEDIFHFIKHRRCQEIAVQDQKGHPDVPRGTEAVTEHLHCMGNVLILEPTADGSIPIMDLDGQRQAENLEDIPGQYTDSTPFYPHHRPTIRFRGARPEMVLAHTVKMSSHPQESARKKCSMLL